MKPQPELERDDLYTIRRLAGVLGLSPENIRALEKRGRLPEGCRPQTDPATGTRYWTQEQVDQLKRWNEERSSRENP